MNLNHSSDPSPSLVYDQTSSAWVVWWRTIRPATLWAGVAPLFVGASLAAQHGVFQLVPVFAALIGSLLIQIGCNLVNDYSDFERGADTENRLGPARAASQGWLSVDQLKRGAMICFGFAILDGVYLTWIGGWPILILGVLSVLCAIAYTAGPFPLGYRGLGDLFVMIFFGFGAVCGTYYLQAQTLHSSLFAASWAVGALATSILVVNNLRDRVGDQQVGKRTLAVRFGETFTRWQYTLLMLSAFIVVIIEGLNQQQVWGWSVPLLLLPFAVLRVREIWRLDGAALNPLLGKTAQLELLFCLFLSGGLLW